MRQKFKTEMGIIVNKTKPGYGNTNGLERLEVYLIRQFNIILGKRNNNKKDRM